MKKIQLISFLLILIGCVSPTDKIETKSNFKFNLDLKNIPGNVSGVRGDLLEENTLHNISFNFVLDTINETASATLTDIPVGDYQLTVSAYNDQSEITHQATADVTISLDQTETIDLTFTEMTGDLIVNVVWPEPDTTQYVIKTFNLLFRHDTASVFSESDVSIDLYISKDPQDITLKFILSKPLHVRSINGQRRLENYFINNGPDEPYLVGYAEKSLSYEPPVFTKAYQDDHFFYDPNETIPLESVNNWLVVSTNYNLLLSGDDGIYGMFAYFDSNDIDTWFNQELYDSLYADQKLEKQSFEQIQNMPDYLQKMLSN